ncbi:mutarotase [uncultured Chryseobacterium sp.]|uniref:2'-5' RNA ligase family protein n=1 Tax=uncultured Chryseobacterium sp. TaxID=259322 RepID=UPI0025CD6B89|nr:mutarotase [uncultured Chryseobacterium sp.]
MHSHSTLSELYDHLFYQSIGKIQKGDILLDEMIDNPADKRRGLTLLIRPNNTIADKIYRFQREIENIDGEQYYQPDSDLHITALSIISCYDGFDLTQVSVPDYVKIIAESIKDITEIKLNFKGISTSREAVMIQGFSMNNNLDTLRNRLRKDFRLSTLQQSIDSRYKLSSAHITAIRFRKILKSPDSFASMLQSYREIDFGEMQAGSLDLVYNDWYQKGSVVKILHRFTL